MELERGRVPEKVQVLLYGVLLASVRRHSKGSETAGRTLKCRAHRGTATAGAAVVAGIEETDLVESQGLCEGPIRLLVVAVGLVDQAEDVPDDVRGQVESRAAFREFEALFSFAGLLEQQSLHAHGLCAAAREHDVAACVDADAYRHALGTF